MMNAFLGTILVYTYEQLTRMHLEGGYRQWKKAKLFPPAAMAADLASSLLTQAEQQLVADNLIRMLNKEVKQEERPLVLAKPG